MDRKQMKHNYYIKYDKLSKTKTVIKLYRNNLSLKCLDKDFDNKHILVEEINYKGCIVKISITFKADYFPDTLTNSKEFKVRGVPNDFTVFSRTDIKSFPATIRGENQVCIYNIRFEGTYEKLKKDFEMKRIYERAEKKKCGIIINHNSNSIQREIPSTVQWNISHPYQGGKVSPK